MAKELLGWMEADRREFEVLYVVSTKPFNSPKYNHIEVRARADVYDAADYLLAVMDPYLKRKIARENEDRWATYVHDTACVSSYAEIGQGSILAPWSMITGDGRCGKFVFLSGHATIGHDSDVGDYSSVLPYSELLGHSSLGCNCLMGANSFLYHGVHVPAGSRISVGAVVRKTPDCPATHYGDPRGAHRIISHDD